MSALRILSAMFDVDTARATTSLQSLDKGISTAKASLGAMAVALIGAFSVRAFAGFISQQIDVGDALDKTSKRLGVSTDELQKFQYAADLSGVSAEQAATALGFLNKNMGEALGGGSEQVKAFAELGVTLKDAQGNVRELGDVVPELADGFAKMGSQQERTAAAMRLFGRSGAQLLPLLTQGSGAINEMNQQFEDLGLGIDQDFIDKSAEAKDAISRLHRGFGALKTKIAVEILPTITEWSAKISKGIAWVIKLTKQTHIVKEVLAVAGVVGAAAGLKMALGWAKFFGIFPRGNAGILKTLASMGYIGIIIGLVAALALIFEDLFVGIQGGQSVIRNWLNETLGVEGTNELFANLGQIVDQIKASFSNMSPSVASLVKMLASIAVSPAFVATIEFIVRLLGSMVALLVAAARAAGNIVSGDFAGAGKAVDQGGDAVFGKNGFFGENAFKPYAPRSPAVAPPAGQGSPVAVTQDNKTTITVNGAGDPEAVGRRVATFQRGAANENAAALAALATGASE
jgi:TP901 family phage tail tape measure protein